MLAELLFLLTEFAAQTVILFVLLCLMIKIQRLDHRFEFRLLGVLGAAALAIGLDLILQKLVGHFIGIYLAAYVSTPIVFIVLLQRVKSITGTDYLDALFTVAISYALLFGINLFILSSWLGDLRSTTENTDEFEVAPRRQEIKRDHYTAIPTNPPPLSTNLPFSSLPASPVKPEAVKPVEATVAKTNPPAPNVSGNATSPASEKPVKASVPRTNTPASGTSTNPAVPPEPAKPQLTPLAKYLSVKGVTRNDTKSTVTVQTAGKTYIVFLDEAVLMQTPDGPVSVRFAELETNSVTLEINGEPKKYPVR
jgi:hypothetical protein